MSNEHRNNPIWAAVYANSFVHQVYHDYEVTRRLGRESRFYDMSITDIAIDCRINYATCAAEIADQAIKGLCEITTEDETSEQSMSVQLVQPCCKCNKPTGDFAPMINLPFCKDCNQRSTEEFLNLRKEFAAMLKQGIHPKFADRIMQVKIEEKVCQE